MKFKGRIGWSVLLLWVSINIFTFRDGLDGMNGNIQGFVLLCSIFFLLDLMLLDLSLRNYTIVREDGAIEVRLGVFKQIIQCKDIKVIKRTRNPISGMSLSSKRLEIDYAGGKALISVNEEGKFMGDLKKINPRITINN